VLGFCFGREHLVAVEEQVLCFVKENGANAEEGQGF
jgi:hypothetical protein